MGRACVEAEAERETVGGRGPRVLGCVPRGHVGIEDKPWPGEVVAAATLGVGRGCLCGNDLAVDAPVSSTGLEGVSAPRGECHHHGRIAVGRIAARGAAAAWPWSRPLGCQRK